EWGLSFEETVARLLPAGAIYFQMDEEDLRRILRYPRTMIGSDGLPHDLRPHPRLWGSFARVLGRYVRDENLLSLQDAVHRMTGLPAQVYGFKDRGTIAAGKAADLVLFDLGAIADTATYDDPQSPARGIARVLVNGETVWAEGSHTGARPGRLLRRAS
ncbi:MAG: amidohydrolase family protein, partial [Rhodospirillales bacterium]|nr:amidohydrolase family protein [Rhodospirillales bacterium]